MDKLYEYGIQEAIVQSKFSTCLSSHYGAAIIDPSSGHCIAGGRNGAPKGKEHCTDRGWCIKRELGYNHFQTGIDEWLGMYFCCNAHAEENAIIQAGYERTNGCIMFLYGERNGTPTIPQPCFHCTKLLINAGINAVVIRPATEFIMIDVSELYDNYIHQLYEKLNTIEDKGAI